MPTRIKLNDHPRLYIGHPELDRLKQLPRWRVLRDAAEQVSALARQYVKSPVFDWEIATHNAHLIRARTMQTRIVTLLTEWSRTGEQRFRDAAVAHVAEMGAWECWSWITWRQKDYRPEAIFDLSYGENSSTLAIAYDWLYDTLTDAEREMFLRIARERALKSFLIHGRKGGAWWVGHPASNWNTVCAGGGGMLALAMYEDLPEARRALPMAERSVVPFFRSLRETNGGWPEGIGYWNYGMRYGFMYLLSHERATGRRHPLLDQPATAKTLSFPLDFCPNGVPCSFGDVNHWSPFPVHYAVASRLKCTDVLQALDARLERTGLTAGGRPNAAELLLFHPRTAMRRRSAGKATVKLFKGLDWGVIADRMPDPSIYLAVRGGTTEVPHAHRDLMSFHCVVADESMITNVGTTGYLDTTFSPRRWELFEMNPSSKNMILINGVGIAGGSTVKTSIVRLPGAEGLRIDATDAMGSTREGAAATFCGRLFLMLKRKAFLIVDRVEVDQYARIESRMHTHADVRLLRRGAALKGERQKLRVAYASDVPSSLHTAVGAPTNPAKGATMLRWCTDRLHKTMTMATLLVPGAATAKVTISEKDGKLIIDAACADWSARVRVSEHLQPSRGTR